MDSDVFRRLAQASKGFGALRKTVFMDKHLRLPIKKRIYDTCVLPVLLWFRVLDSSDETWQEIKLISSQMH